MDSIELGYVLIRIAHRNATPIPARVHYACTVRTHVEHGVNMAEENRQRRVKKTGAAKHRTGEYRAAVKPGIVGGGEVARRAIEEFMGQLAQGTTTQTAWGSRLDLVAESLRQNYGLAPDEKLYLLLDLDRTGAGIPGMLLSETGLRLKGGTGGSILLSWSDLPKTTVGINAQGVLVVGQSGIVADDGKVIAALLQHIQSKLAQ